MHLEIKRAQAVLLYFRDSLQKDILAFLLNIQSRNLNKMKQAVVKEAVLLAIDAAASYSVFYKNRLLASLSPFILVRTTTLFPKMNLAMSS